MKTIKISTAIIIALFTSLGMFAQTPKNNVSIEQEIIIDAPIANAWQVLGPEFPDVSKWAASVGHSEARDHISFNGSVCTERGCKVDGIGAIKEKLLVYSGVDHKLTYQVYEGMPKMVKYAVNSWTLTQLEGGKTKAVSHIEMRIGGMMGKMMKGMMKKKMKKLQQESLEEFKYYVENGQPHPRKVKATSNLNS